MIEPLEHLTDEQARSLIVGYSSAERYVVRTSEGAQSATFTLERESIGFEKRFPISEAMIGWYRSLLPDGLSFGAYENGELVGLAIAGYMDWNSTCTVWELHVDPGWRRRGIATALLRAVESAAHRKGARRVWIETQATNTPAIDMYRSTGYEIAGLDMMYYTNDDPQTGEIAIFMQSKLG